jgi:hypothetical protein
MLGLLSILLFSQNVYAGQSDFVVEATKKFSEGFSPVRTQLLGNWRCEDSLVPINGRYVHTSVFTDVDDRIIHAALHEPTNYFYFAGYFGSLKSSDLGLVGSNKLHEQQVVYARIHNGGELVLEFSIPTAQMRGYGYSGPRAIATPEDFEVWAYSVCKRMK